MKSLGTARIFLIAAATAAGLFAALSMPRAESEFTEEVKKQREKQLRDVDTVKQEIDSLRKKIAEKKWKFEVGETEASRYSLKMISGYKEIKEEKKSYAISNGKVVIKPDNADKKDAIPKEGLLADPDSASFNLRDKGLLTPIRSQKGCGSCWAFTAIGTYESAYLIRNGVSLDLSEQFIVNCARSGSCSGGSYSGVFKFLLANSAIDEKLAPYKSENQPCLPVWGAQKEYTLEQYGWVKPSSGKKLTVMDVKKAICAYGPIASSMVSTTAFHHYKGGIFNEHGERNNYADCGTRAGHAMVIVGWDDSKNSWLVKNSWNEGWGEKGYVWMEYGCNGIGEGGMWVVAKKVQK